MSFDACRSVPGGGLPRARAGRAVRAADGRDRGALPGLPAVRRRVRGGHPASDRGRVGDRPARRDRAGGRRRTSRSATGSRRSRCWSRASRAAGTAAGACPSGRSDRDELAVLAPGDPQPVADLADRRVGADRRRGSTGIRLPSPRATASSPSIAAVQASAERSARTRRTRSIWRRSPSGSIRWSGGVVTSSSRNG